MLLGAGLAPAYPDARVDRAARAALLDLLDGVLDGHLPNPALVLDAEFDVVATNSAVDRLLGALVEPDLLDPPVNVVRVTRTRAGSPATWATSGPGGRTCSARSASTRPPRRARRRHIRAPDAAARRRSDAAAFQHRRDVGTPLDVAASELAIETFLPADLATRQWLAHHHRTTG